MGPDAYALFAQPIIALNILECTVYKCNWKKSTAISCNCVETVARIIYKKIMCANHNRRYALCSPLCSQRWPPRSIHTGANSATGHSPSLVRQRGTVCLWTSVLHWHHLHLRTCLKHIGLCFRCPEQLLVTHVLAFDVVRRPCSGSGMLRCLINCRIIII